MNIVTKVSLVIFLVALTLTCVACGKKAPPAPAYHRTLS